MSIRAEDCVAEFCFERSWASAIEPSAQCHMKQRPLNQMSQELLRITARILAHLDGNAQQKLPRDYECQLSDFWVKIECPHYSSASTRFGHEAEFHEWLQNRVELDSQKAARRVLPVSATGQSNAWSS
jgi:hypothetical protein